MSYRSFSLLLRMMVLGAAAPCCGGGDGGASSTASAAGSRIDDLCSSALQCAADSAECVDIGDGAQRCEAQCLADKACGDGASCLFKGDSSVGWCYRKCDTVQDCVSPDWRCEQYASDTTQPFCLPPCLLSDCTSTSFTYTCSSSGYVSDITISGGTTTASYTFSNGHTVNCAAQNAHGSCRDDTGSTCSF